jgi:CRP-like cAMP-binding protein
LSLDNTLFNNFPTRNFKKGQLLIFQGEVPRFGYVLKKGRIREYDISKQGNEQTTWLINVSEVFPFPWLIGAATTASYYYETASDCQLYILGKDDYQELLRINKVFLMHELERQAKKEISQTRRLAAILNSKAEYKLVNTFQYLIESYGYKIDNDNVEINIPLTHQEIANLTGLTRETVSKELSAMKKNGLISQRKNRSIYTINIPLLNKLLSTPLSDLSSPGF